MVVIVGAGFAGVEAAWALASRGVPVILYEMRPQRMTPAHTTDHFAELVCSNSFKSKSPTSPAGQLKKEMEALGSIVLATAYEHEVPAGEALGVDREAFGAAITKKLEEHPLIEIRREEFTPEMADEIVQAFSPPSIFPEMEGGVRGGRSKIQNPKCSALILATGPLTSPEMAEWLAQMSDRQHLYFYDAVSPTVEASSLDRSIIFAQSRYDKGEGDDYLNCPFNKEEYEAFVRELVAAERAPIHAFEAGGVRGDAVVDDGYRLKSDRLTAIGDQQSSIIDQQAEALSESPPLEGEGCERSEQGRGGNSTVSAHTANADLEEPSDNHQSPIHNPRSETLSESLPLEGEGCERSEQGRGDLPPLTPPSISGKMEGGASNPKSKIENPKSTEERYLEKIKYFAGCTPIEAIAEKGARSLAFGNFKPVGLTDPRTGRRPWAALQLRPENKEKTLYSLVACQTRLKWGEQKRIFRMVPGMENAEFVRFGVIHRNTYIEAPKTLNANLEMKDVPGLFIAGQLTGVEGYVESAAMGIYAGLCVLQKLAGKEPAIPPRSCAYGSLVSHLQDDTEREFAPMNINWGLFPEPETPIRDKGQKRAWKLEQANKVFEKWFLEYGTV
ncbi:MAG: methylenetetrahydrofolate--tRNA-(uracil(54)-C(5))-methyltransferase (FADH(2)-oxidizing) TrmFO [Fimbriimonadaceae bacterium]|nr:methylenetetrahydrofolate--tRNA-(uracil(54)-C(5))-methyltransferase (FADH(2)-oxidizing) TrmFO [Fimbriimonadaceae bacterium]